MKNINYKQIIQKINTLDELEVVKNDFLSECVKRENKIKTSEIINKIDNFGSAKHIFENISHHLLQKKGGKALINKYINVIKENKSLKTLYACHEGLNQNNTVESKKVYITEALSIAGQINYNEYINGLSNIISIISESFNLLGDEFILNNVECDKNIHMIGESLVYLSTTKKNIKNLNDYINHINIVTENVIKNDAKTLDVDSTLEEIVSKFSNNINDIFETEDKVTTFQKTKNICLEMISKQKEINNDEEIMSKLSEMEEKLSNKQYTYETFTKDMLYMTELQEVLK